MGLSGEVPNKPSLAEDAHGPSVQPRAGTQHPAGSGTSAVTLAMFMGFPSCVAPVLALPWAGAVWLFGSTGNHPAMLCSQCQALCGVIRTIITGPIPCHVLPAQCVCHISSPGAWRAEGTAGNHNGMQTGASKKSVAATFPPLCCALYSLRHLCLSCVVSPKEGVGQGF